MERRPRCDDRPREYANVTTTENGGKKVENAAPSILSSFLLHCTVKDAADADESRNEISAFSLSVVRVAF